MLTDSSTDVMYICKLDGIEYYLTYGLYGTIYCHSYCCILCNKIERLPFISNNDEHVEHICSQRKNKKYKAYHSYMIHNMTPIYGD
jgi:hypothetical protein